MCGKPLHTLAAAALLLLAPLPRLVAPWRIEPGGTIAEEASSGGGELARNNDLERRQQLALWQEERRAPPNVADPDYFHPSARGGRAGHPGADGLAVLVAKVHSHGAPTRFEAVDVPPVELRAGYFAREGDDEAVQEYVVPGDGRRRPYKQEVTVKLWGGGGGGCDGGRGGTTESLPEEGEDDTFHFIDGSGGGYVEATFALPVGDQIQIEVGGGGQSRGSLPDTLGGKGGFNGGHPGKDDGMSGGGGGGGMTTVSWNGTVLAAAYGGVGGGNTTYCRAMGGAGASLRGQPKEAGGYINLDLALADNGLEEERICPGVPEITMLSHDAATFAWSAGSNERSREDHVQRYTVHLSEGNLEEDTDTIECSDEYRLNEHIRRSIDITQNATTSLEGLRAAAPYCIRVEAFSVEGLSLGVQVLPFATKSTPENEWVRVNVRQSEVSDTLEEDASDGDESISTWCEHSTSRPTGRRGHSMSIVNDHVYIFGGATMKCVCDLDASNGEKQCSPKNVYSDELWHFEPRTATFARLERSSEEEPWPRGREQHSATVLPNGDIIVIGGMTSSSDGLEIGDDPELLADVWRMRDPHHISSHVFSSDDLNDDMPELIPGHVTSHGLPISLGDETFSGDLCIDDIQVDVSLEHNCLKAIEYIKLTGPEIDVASHDAPQSRKYQAKIYVGNTESRGAECHASTLNLSFSDAADESVLSHPSIPISGAFRPATSLAQTFVGLPLTGEWTLSIASAQPMHPQEYTASLLSWEAKVDVTPCVPIAKWEKLPMPPPNFSPRRLHTAIAVDDSIFVMGGFAEGRLDDLWRFDHASSTWTELNNAALRGQWPLNGQTAFLSQYGLLAYGGLSSHGPQKQGHDLWLLDLFGEDWVHVPVSQDGSRAHEHFNNGLPYTRYLSSIGFLNDADTIYQSYGIDGKGPMAVVFGGDGGLLHNAYPDRYNSLFADVWLLSPGGMRVGSSMEQRSREDYCEWGWAEGSTALQTWNDACGWVTSVGTPEPCSLEDILIAAWCRGQYQSFFMSSML